MALAIGIDIGGTKVAGGVVDDFGRVLDSQLRPTPAADVTRTEEVIVDVVAALAARHQVEAVGIGAAGWIASDRATVLFSPHLAWRGEPLRAALADRISLPVLVDNDANGAAWAEYRFGAGIGARALACVTLGTGIGGGLVIDGHLYRGAFGTAGEFGHTTVVPDGRRCACGNRGCWEMYCSGTALASEARELAEVAPVAAHRMLELADGSLDLLTGEIVASAAREGDAAAIEICVGVGRWLGRGLANLAVVLDPDVFVIGGGVGSLGDMLIDPARAEFAATLPGRGYRPAAEISLARLGPSAGLVGVADLARREYGARSPNTTR
jgi:glucokinase